MLHLLIKSSGPSSAFQQRESKFSFCTNILFDRKVVMSSIFLFEFFINKLSKNNELCQKVNTINNNVFADSDIMKQSKKKKEFTPLNSHQCSAIPKIVSFTILSNSGKK